MYDLQNRIALEYKKLQEFNSRNVYSIEVQIGNEGKVQYNLYSDKLMKREQFRKNIREKQLQNIFHQIRKSKVGKIYVFPEVGEQIANIIMEYINQSIREIASLKSYNKYDCITNKFEQCLQTAKKQGSTFSYALNKCLKQVGDHFIDVFKKDIPESVLGDLDEDDNGEKLVQNEISLESNFLEEVAAIQKVLQLSVMIEYDKFNLQSAILITKALWNVFSQEYHLPNKHYPQTHLQSTKIMLNLCSSLYTLLQNPENHSILKKQMKQMGLPQKISTIIDTYTHLRIDEYVKILDLIHMFSRKTKQEVIESSEEDLGGVCIIGVDSGYYDKFCAFCLYFLKKGDPRTLLNSLSALEQIFNEASYLIDSCEFSCIVDIINLVNFNDRQISSKALQVLNTVIFYSQSASDDLIEKTNLLQVINERLRKEQVMPQYDIYAQESIQRCTNILCDVLLSRNKRVKQKIFGNPIWQYLYECIQEHHPLLGTVVVFNYFFDGFGRRRSLKILPSYLQAISNLNLNNESSPHIKDVKEALRDLYARGLQFWEQDDFNELVQMFQNYNLLKVIEDE